MPQNKVQGRVYGLVMSLTMTFLMEVWATAVRAGVQLEPGGLSNIGWPVVTQAARGFLPTVAVVILIAETYGTKLAMRMAGRICDFRRDPQALCALVRAGCNTLVMCSSVLLYVAAVFNVALGGRTIADLPTIWLGLMLQNLPLALTLNLLVATPLATYVLHAAFPETR